MGRTFILAVLTLVGTVSISMEILLLLSFSFRFAVFIGSLVFLVVVHFCLDTVDSFHEEMHFGLGWG